ncbi:hypothetical protein Hsar01_02314 [Haloferula sargassicola]|uniref:C-type lectin domain-containing protein n=1 Tax=Haloferula sargassicola TaxID=490096 RepID=A0ABP9UNS7_9BACT
MPEETTVWLGAGRIDGKSWVQVDGTPWPLNRDPSGAGDFATLDALGIARAKSRDTELPFLIQWRRDSSNPGSLEAMLQRAADTVFSPKPVFPPGTRAQDVRHFCAIMRPVGREEAMGLAKLAGGTLAAPATRDEQLWMEESYRSLVAPEGVWLGAEKKGSTWIWTTGETWDATAWAEGALPDDLGRSAMVFVPGKGWQDTSPSQTADGFMIEWSLDGGAPAVSDEGEAALGNAAVSELRGKAVELVTKAEADHRKDLIANRDKLVWDLNVWLRGLNVNDRNRWEAHNTALVAKLQDAEDGRIPSPAALTENKEILLSADMKKNCAFYFEKQAKIDAGNVQELKRIRDAYAKRLQTIADDLPEAGNDEVVASITRMIHHSQNVEGWARGLTQ